MQKNAKAAYIQSLIKIAKPSPEPKVEKKSRAVHFRVSAELAEKLEEIAKENGITISSVVAIACARIAKTGI